MRTGHTKRVLGDWCRTSGDTISADPRLPRGGSPGQSLGVRVVNEDDFWQSFAAALALFLLGRIATTIGNFSGSRASAIAEVVIIDSILVVLALWFPKVAATALVALAAGQALIWTSEIAASTSKWVLVLALINAAAAIMSGRALVVTARAAD